jgi:hypothetical protein
MYTPLISGCGGGRQFVEKIKTDFLMIHSAPSLSSEALLQRIHQQAEIWLLNFAQKNILMVPGHLRAGLQTFEGGEVDDVSQQCTFTMQHNPRSLLPELKNSCPLLIAVVCFHQKALMNKMDLQSHIS